MKKLFLAGLLAWSALPVQAQWLGADAFGNALWGGIIGGLLGGRHHAGEGAAIGAGAGLLLGALSSGARSEPTYYPNYGPSPYYGYESRDYYSRPNYAGSGAVFGGLAGAVIGHNSGHRGLEGAAIGAGAGLLLGSIAENQARREAAAQNRWGTAVSTAPAHAIPVYQAPPPQYGGWQNAPTIPNAPVVPLAPQWAPSPANPMSRANSLFGR